MSAVDDDCSPHNSPSGDAWQQEAKRLRAENERLRRGIAAKRKAFAARASLHDRAGGSAEAAHECYLAIAALDALARGDGSGCGPRRSRATVRVLASELTEGEGR